MPDEPNNSPQKSHPGEQLLPVNRNDPPQTPLRKFGQRIGSLIDAPLKYLFGRDIFISYSRADASKYAPKLSNVLKEEVKGLSLYLDRWIAPPTGELPWSMRRQLRWSSLLVLIASENALKSKYVKEEIRRFAATGRQIIPINVDGEWEKIDWTQDPWRDVRGAAAEPETKSNVENGTPSREVIDRIKNSTLFTRQDQRLRRAVGGTVASIVVLVVVAIGVSSLIVQSARAEAAQEIKVAQDRRRDAEAAANAAEERARIANDKSDKAELRAQDADRRAGESEDRKKKAEADLGVAKLAEAEAIKRRDEAARMEQRASLVAQARTALSTGYPQSGYTLARDSLKIKDLPDARLLLAEAYNRGLPHELKYFNMIQNLSVSTTGGNKVAAIGVTSEEKSFNNRLKLWDMDAHTSREVSEYRFFAAQFAPDGQNLFAVALTKYAPGEGSGLDQKIDMEVSLIKYDLSLKELARIPIKLPALANKDYGVLPRRNSEWDVREIQDLRIDKTNRRLVMAGYAAQASTRFISDAPPHHLRSWVDLSDLSMRHSIDTENELSSFTRYRGRVVLAADNQIIVDGTDEVYSIDMTSGERKQVGKHTAEVTDLAVSPSGAIIAAAGGDKLSVFTRSGEDWQREVIDFAGGADGEFVTFIGERKIAVTRHDFAITIVSLEQPKQIVLDGKTEWKSARLTNLSGHTARIQIIKVSPDGRWLATAGEDRTIRLWSLFEDERHVFQGSQRGVTQLEFGPGSEKLFAGGLDGAVRIYNLSSPHRFSLPVHPPGTKQEFSVVDAKWDEGGNLTRAILRQDWGFVRSLKWSRDYEYLYATTYDKVTAVWDRNYTRVDDARSKELIARTGGFNQIGRLEVTPDKRLVLSHSANRITDNDEKEENTGLPKSKGKSNVVKPIFSFDDRRFIQLSYDDASIYLWEGINLSPIRLEKIYGDFHRDQYGHFDSHEWAKFSHGGRYFAFPFDSDEPAICVIDVSGAKAYAFKGDILPEVFDISDDGDLVVAGRTGKIYMHSVLDNKTRLLEKYGQHSRYVTSLAFSPDAKWIASGSRDRTVRLWSRSGNDYIDFSLLNPIEEVVFGPSGKELLVAAGLGVHAWYVPTGTLDEVMSAYSSPAAESDPESRPSEETSETQKVVPSFLTYRTNASLSQAVIEEALGRRVELSNRRMNELAVLLTTEGDGADRTLAALELSLYGPRAVALVPRICLALKQLDKYKFRPDPNVVALLKLIGPGAEAPFLNTFANTKDQELKSRMALAISSLYPTSTRSLTTLRAALNDANRDVRIAAALSLAKANKDRKAIPHLAAAVGSEYYFREDAAELLVGYGKDAVPALIDTFDTLTRSGYHDTSRLARESLVKIGKDAFPFLVDALKEKKGGSLLDVVYTLSAMSPDSGDIVPPLIEMLKSQKEAGYSNDSLLSAVSSALGSMGAAAQEAIPYLMDVFLNGSDSARISVSIILDKLGPKTLPYLIKALPVTNDSQRSSIVRAIGKYGPLAKDATPLLVQALWSDDVLTPNAAAEALGDIGPDASAAVPDLVKLLDVETKDYVRINIIEALGKIGANPSLTVPALMKAIEAENRRIADRVFLVSDSSLRRLEAGGVPSDIIQVLERFNSDQPLEEGQLVDRLYQAVEKPERLVQYKELILKQLEYNGPRSCGDRLLSRQRAAYLALGKFGPSAAQAIPQIEQMKERYPQCTDLRQFADDALKLIRKRPENLVISWLYIRDSRRLGL